MARLGSPVRPRLASLALAWRAAVAAAGLLGVVCGPALAGRAEAHAEEASALAVPVVVLALDSDDAEEQADALTGAMKSRIRAAPGLSLVESSASLGMLTAALKCPRKPTPECQDKIADQLKANAYVYGYVAKGPKGQVTADVHLYQRGKPDKAAKESYASSLKDANDDSLRAIAGKLLDVVTASAIGTIVVQAEAPATEVVLDGQRHVPLTKGTARLPVAPGSHSVEASFDGAPEKRTVRVEAGKEAPVELAAAKKVAPPPAEEAPSISSRKVFGIAALAGGVALGVLAVERALRYSEMQDQVTDPRFQQAIDSTGGKSIPACDATGPGAQQACNVSKNAQGVSAVAIGAGAAGAVLLGTGVYLLFFGGRESTEKGVQVGAARARFVPYTGRDGTGLGVVGSF